MEKLDLKKRMERRVNQSMYPSDIIKQLVNSGISFDNIDGKIVVRDTITAITSYDFIHNLNAVLTKLNQTYKKEFIVHEMHVTKDGADMLVSMKLDHEQHTYRVRNGQITDSIIKEGN